MKNINKFLAIALASASLASCADLDTEYLGYYVTSEQKQEVLAKDPDMALAGVTGCFANSYVYMAISSDHDDFGYPAIMMGLDSQTEDFIGKYSGYNWFQSWEAYTQFTNTGFSTNLVWTTIYKQINACNTLLATIPADTESNELKFYRAQGLALRAFDYWVLAQLYQFNYSVNPNAYCVPIITDENADVSASEGAPRATVEEVYAQIIKDASEAVDLLAQSGVNPASIVSSKPNRLISLATAYGIRARAYLSMHKYTEAAADARQAIANFSGRPYTMAEVSVPAFTSMDEPSWMWGIAVAETDRPVTSGIVNFPSMMGSFNYGYCQYGAWRWISKKLYETINDSDVRKGWWLNENYQSPNINADQTAYLANYINEANVVYQGQQNNNSIMPYTQVKYNSYKGDLGQSTNASDIPLMRVEEMYLTLAEAEGMSAGVQNGISTLESFVKAYRDPAYKCIAADAAAFQDECWRQRRIELWGEGLSWFDVLRLNKPVDRVGCLFPAEFTYQIPAGDLHLIYTIPLDEITANKALKAGDKGGDENYTSLSRPTPVQ